MWHPSRGPGEFDPGSDQTAGVSRNTACLGSSASIAASGASGAASKYGRVTRTSLMYFLSTGTASAGAGSATRYLSARPPAGQGHLARGSGVPHPVGRTVAGHQPASAAHLHHVHRGRVGPAGPRPGGPSRYSSSLPTGPRPARPASARLDRRGPAPPAAAPPLLTS